MISGTLRSTSHKILRVLFLTTLIKSCLSIFTTFDSKEKLEFCRKQTSSVLMFLTHGISDMLLYTSIRHYNYNLQTKNGNVYIPLLCTTFTSFSMSHKKISYKYIFILVRQFHICSLSQYLINLLYNSLHSICIYEIAMSSSDSRKNVTISENR